MTNLRPTTEVGKQIKAAAQAYLAQQAKVAA
jgi:hypothetical protein